MRTRVCSCVRTIPMYCLPLSCPHIHIHTQLLAHTHTNTHTYLHSCTGLMLSARLLRVQRTQAHTYLHSCTGLMLSARLLRAQGVSLGFLINELWWPCSAGEALAAGLVMRLPDGRIAISTSDGSARMVGHSLPLVPCPLSLVPCPLSPFPPFVAFALGGRCLYLLCWRTSDARECGGPLPYVWRGHALGTAVLLAVALCAHVRLHNTLLLHVLPVTLPLSLSHTHTHARTQHAHNTCTHSIGSF